MKNTGITPALIALFLSGCDSSSNRILQPETEMPRMGVAKLALLVPATVPSQLVKEVKYSVSGTGISRGEEIRGAMSFAGSKATATINVPVGTNRIFSVTSFTDDNIATYQGSATGDVEYGETTTISLDMVRKLGSVYIGGTVPANSTHVEFTFGGLDIPTPVVIVKPRAFRGEYEFSNIPTGANISLHILAYEDSKDRVTAQAEIAIKVHHNLQNSYNFESDAGSGNVELVAEFPE